MNSKSALIRRSILLTGATLATFAIVFIAVFLPFETHFSRDGARETALSQARQLAENIANDSDEQLAQEATLLYKNGTLTWLIENEHTNSLSGGEVVPKAAENILDHARQGGEGFVYSGSRVLCAVPSVKSGQVLGVILVSVPMRAESIVFSFILAVIAGLIVAILVGLYMEHKLMRPIVKPLGKLRDVAVAVADGELDVKASETAPGEIGELGKALNNVSTQLAHNLYALIIERNRLKQIIDGLSEGILALDVDGRVTVANSALERMFNVPHIVRHTPETRVRLIHDMSVWNDFDSVIAGGDVVTRTFALREMVIRMTVTPTVDELGNIAGAVGLFSDITQSERLEQTRRDYVSNVSHELRTPLTAMRALVEPLKDGMVTEEADRMRYYDIILREITRLSRLINDQLELSRLQSGSVSIEKKLFAPDDLVYDVCDRYNNIASEHGLELRVPTDFTALPKVFGNADRVEQVLIILVDNAIKYTEKGFVEVSGTFDADKVILSVSDSGIGIDERDLPYVFDRFYKVDKAHSGKGSGLGLSIAKEVCKRMGEEISVVSKQGEGTTFSFTIHTSPAPSAEEKK